MSSLTSNTPGISTRVLRSIQIQPIMAHQISEIPTQCTSKHKSIWNIMKNKRDANARNHFCKLVCVVGKSKELAATPKLSSNNV
mmetsp:Transcript_16074/g.19025  ORF Transcript_16074/g.19025 Transcript_16074/m.19025 type:complete len:84 (+) Transcript_16074:461-712(+)